MSFRALAKIKTISLNLKSFAIGFIERKNIESSVTCRYGAENIS